VTCDKKLMHVLNNLKSFSLEFEFNLNCNFTFIVVLKNLYLLSVFKNVTIVSILVKSRI